jgi:glutathione S-transferase
MSLTLYWNLGSQPARAVKCLLDIAQLPVNLITLDVIKNQTRTKEYLSLNPLGQIPFLVHGNFKLGESNAILVYLCEKFPEKLGLYYGTNTQERAKVNQHLSWYQNFFRPALFRIIFLKVYEGVRRQKPVFANMLKAAEKEMLASMKELELLLAQSNTDFVAGNRLTIADLQYYFEITNLIVYEVKFDQFQLVSAWFKRVESVKEVAAINEEWGKMVPALKHLLKSVPVQENSKL